MKVKVNINPNAIIDAKRLGKGQEVHRFFTNELRRVSDNYVPFRAGALKNNVVIDADGSAITYNSPYARYHWYGKKMVDPEYGVGSFYDKDYGHWSRPGVSKVLTEVDLNYTGAPNRGPKWALRAFADNKEALKLLSRNISKTCKGGVGWK